MRIRVKHNYGGKQTEEKRILPGFYAATDERLFGLADYLVQNGHAEIVSADQPKQVEPEVFAGEPVELDFEDWMAIASELMAAKGVKIKEVPDTEPSLSTADSEPEPNEEDVAPPADNEPEPIPGLVVEEDANERPRKKRK